MWFVRSGARVTGPFNQEQLMAMRERGEFSPMHLVSVDKIRWESAASLVQMLDGPVSPFQTTSKKTSSASARGPAVEARRWYYADEHRQTMGPLEEDILRSMLSAGRLPRNTSVCREGASTWELAIDRAEFTSAIPDAPTFPLMIWGAAGVSILVVCMLGFSILYFTTKETENDRPDGKEVAQKPEEKKDDKKPDLKDKTGNDNAPHKPEESIPEKPPAENKLPSLPAPPNSANGLLITNLDNEEALAQSVGLVVMCIRTYLPNGSILERPRSTGSCFACTKDGYLLTNRHVVESHSPRTKVNLKIDETIIQAEQEQVALVYFKKVRLQARVLHVSSRFDMAVLKVDYPSDMPYFSLSSKPKFNRTVQVAALGYPGVVSEADQEQEAQLTARFNKGLIDALNKRTSVTADTQLLDGAYEYSHTIGQISRMSSDSKGQGTIVHGAQIFPGNSGGPLVDAQGHVLGINTSGKTESLGSGASKISVGTVFFAYTISQFKDEIKVYIPPSKVSWVD